MLFKNHDNNSKNGNTSNLENILSQTKINSVLYSDPFLKAGFIAKLIHDVKIDILYLDLDLLYSGYVVSGMLTTPSNLSLFQPTFELWNKTLTNLLIKLSTKKSIVVVDSLNGLYNLLNERKEIGKLVNSYIMLITSMARKTDSYVVVASMVRFKKEEGWILSTTGKRLIETNMVKKILLKQDESGIILDFLNKEKTVIPSNSIPLV
ncbi:MAG: hypothetical protein ACREAE_09350 [Nitrosopumilaceae archaeon]